MALRIGRIARQQPLNDREDDQQIGLNQTGHHRGETIVVTQFDFGGADGVVLVDDRDRVEFKERSQRVPHIEIPRPVLEVVRGQQQLRGVIAVRAKSFVVNVDQVCLSCRGGGL